MIITGVTMEDADEDGVDEIADPLARAVALKNKGNKYFKGGRYSQAVKCYSESIDNCPRENKSDLSTFYQNRAAAYEQMVRSITRQNSHIYDECQTQSAKVLALP